MSEETSYAERAARFLDKTMLDRPDLAIRWISANMSIAFAYLDERQRREIARKAVEAERERRKFTP